MKIIYSLIVVCALSACTLAPPKSPIVVPDLPVIAPKATVNVEPGLIATCPPLTPLDSTKAYDQEDSLRIIDIWSTQYDTCSKRFAKYVDLTVPVLNINQGPTPAVAPAVPASSVPASK
jgi:hypothetical protein